MYNLQEIRRTLSHQLIAQKLVPDKKFWSELKEKNNGQLRIATPPRVAHAKPPGPKVCERNEIPDDAKKSFVERGVNKMCQNLWQIVPNGKFESWCESSKAC